VSCGIVAGCWETIGATFSIIEGDDDDDDILEKGCIVIKLQFFLGVVNSRLKRRMLTDIEYPGPRMQYPLEAQDFMGFVSAPRGLVA
jgi:hypothetical protein